MTLELLSLSKRYGDVTALDSLSLDVPAGELFGLVGSNGAGKTTAMRIALGVLSADSGEVRWQGAAITPDVRRRTGYMPEERGLYPRMKVGEQLVYFAQLHGMNRADATRAAEQWTDRLGVAARRDDDVQKLSLGNQQRVQLAAALVHQPDLLVLDEPFSGLDPVAVDVMSTVLREQCDRSVPVVFSSHQLDLVERLCDRVGIVRDGRLVALGTVDELRTGDTMRLEVQAPAAPDGVGRRTSPVSCRRPARVTRPWSSWPSAATTNRCSPQRCRTAPCTSSHCDAARCSSCSATSCPSKTRRSRSERASATAATERPARKACRIRCAPCSSSPSASSSPAVRSKAFRITTAIAAVLLVAAAVGGTLLSDDDDVTASIGLVDLPQDNALAVVEAAGTAVDVTLEPEEVGDEAAGRRMVEDGDLDVLLVRGRDGGFTAYSDDELGTEIENAVNVAAVRLALDAVVSDLGGTPQQVDEALAGARVETVSLQTDEYDPERLAIGAIAGLLIYLALLMYGQVVAQGVVEEKSSRIVELLLATIKPWQLMAGKVLGIGLLGIGQLALLGGIGFAAGTITGAITISASALGSIFVWLVIWFLLGYAMYALVFAACGALVSRQEDIGAVVTPITMVVVIGYVVGISVLPPIPPTGSPASCR
ncbi:MAG: ABC transporter permease [Ilumatobacteraceae bacterium]